MRINGVIFDLDGVICSTDRYHYQAWKTIADSIGAYFDEQINQRLRGVGRIESLEIILENNTGTEYTKDQKFELAEKKNKIYQKLLQRMSPDDLSEEVKETLIKLKKQGYKLAIGSSSKNTMFILKQIGLSDFFDAVSDGNNIHKTKPDPEVFLKAAIMICEKPENCLVVEDARAGIEAACNGGFKSVGLDDAGKDPRATYRISRITDLLEILSDA